MVHSEHALDITPPKCAADARDRAFAPRCDQDHRNAHSGSTLLTDILGSVSRALLSLAVLALVVTGCIFALQTIDLADQVAEASPAALGSSQQDHAAEIAALRAEVALVTEQSLELRAELAVLTGQGGVLPQVIDRLQDQRRVNAAHSNALRQLFSTTGPLSASLPSSEEPATGVGSRPIQVTPVATAQQDAPQRVVLIPDGQIDRETAIQREDGD